MSEPSVCEEKTYHELFEAHATDVRNFMYYRTGDLQQAEDLVQEAYLKMWQRCAEVIFSKAKSYLFTIASRLFIDDVRREKVKLAFIKETKIHSDSENPQFILESNEFKERLENAISDLTVKQREVFLMNRIDKMSYQKIADSLGISIKAVENRMGMALKNLRNSVVELNKLKF